jgi:hypothetical protein
LPNSGLTSKLNSISAYPPPNNPVHQTIIEPTPVVFPFTRLSSPNLILLPAFLAVWLLATILGIFLWAVYFYHGDFRQAAYQIRDQKTIIVLIGLAIAAIAGSANYLLCRRFRGTSWKAGMKEAFLVIAFACLMATYPIHAFIDHMRISQWRSECFDLDVARKLDALIAKGEVKDAVRVMEQSFERFDLAKSKLQARGLFTPHPTGANGVGFLFCSLHYAWMDLRSHLPYSVHSYLDMNLVEHTSYTNYVARAGIRDPDKWLPLGREMTASRNPILQTLGFYIIGEPTRFCEAVYEHSDAGNPVFHGLAALLPTGLDPDPHRAARRLNLHRELLLESGPLKDMISDGHYTTVFALASELLGDGELLGEIDKSALVWLRDAEKIEDFDRVVSGHLGSRRSGTVKRLEESLAAHEYAKAVEWMEMACEIHQFNVRAIGADAPVFNPVNDDFGDNNTMAPVGNCGLPLLMPAAVRHFLDKATEYDTYYMQNLWDGKPKFRDSEKWIPLAMAMTRARTPIVCVVGYWLLGDREGFIKAVYSRLDQGDENFRLMNRFVEESIDPDKRRVAERMQRRKSSAAAQLQAEEKVTAYFNDLTFRSIVKKWAIGYLNDEQIGEQRGFVVEHMKSNAYREESARGAYRGKVEEDLRKLQLLPEN